LTRKWRGLAIALLSAYFAYMSVNVIYLGVTGSAYGMQTLRDYVTFMTTLSARIPIWGTDVMFDTMQNSLSQTFSRYLGVGTLASMLTLGVQFVIVSLFAWLVYRVVVKQK